MAVDVFVIAAMCGNFWGESGVNPGIWEGLTVGAPGYGLGQWTDIPPTLYRRTQLFNWLSANGYSQDSGDGQLAYLVYENYWLQNGQYGSLFLNLQDFLNYVPATPSLSELETLTYAWNQGWEGIPIDTNRFTWAQQILDYLVQHGSDPRDPWYKGNYYLSTSERYKNCLLIYDYFNGTPPPPPPPPTPIPDEAFLTIIGKIHKKKESELDVQRKRPSVLF